MKTLIKTPILYLFVFLLVLSSCKKEDLMLKENTVDNTKDIINVKSGQSISDNVILYAGQNIIAGEIILNVSNDFLTVTYNTENGFVLEEAHLFVGESLEDMPQTRNGNPKIGLFPYKANELGGISSYVFEIPLDDLGGVDYICGKSVFIAAHAVVHRINEDGSSQYETAWGDGDLLAEQGSWAMYFSYNVVCETDEPRCESAFGYGSSTFIDYGLTDSRWGWVIEVPGAGSFSTPIYAGAAQNDLSKGVLVGELVCSFDGKNLHVEYVMNEGYVMSETQLYASNLIPNTIAFGQFGNAHYFSIASYDEYNLVVTGPRLYLIAHAVVCPKRPKL